MGRGKVAGELGKHRVHFEDAKSVFNDPLLLTFSDDAHSFNEPRDISIGLSARHSLLLVVHTERKKNIRIISASKATARERMIYETY